MEPLQSLRHGCYGVGGSDQGNGHQQREKLSPPSSAKRLWIIFLVATALLLPGGCARKALAPLTVKQFPFFTDDQHYEHLEQAISRSLAYLETRPNSEYITIAGRSYPLQHLKNSLLFFQQCIVDRPAPDQLTTTIKAYFDVLQATGKSGFNPDREMLVTSYYQPIFAGSMTRSAPYLYPLYSIPDDLAVRHEQNGAGRTIGRLEKNEFLPYWTRREIETLKIAEGQELVWLRSPIDAFLLHIQGSGLIRLPDGSLRGVHYALSNGQPYSSIGKYMVKTDRISLEAASLETIRSYLTRHPQEQDEVLHQNNSFIFFTWTDTHEAIGNIGQYLTQGRSVAVDQTIFPPGALAYLTSQKPVLEKGLLNGWEPLHRFVLAQDSGSAIRGPGRVDLFWGRGNEAGTAAGMMKEAGHLYVLLLKEKYLQNQPEENGQIENRHL